MSELEQALNELNRSGELVNEVEIDMDDLDIINFYEEQVPEGEELSRFEPCIYAIEDYKDCDPVNLKCNASCRYTAGCIFNPYSEYYNMPMEEFKACIEEMNIFEQLVEQFYNSPDGEAMMKEFEAQINAIVEKHKAENE